MKKHVADRERKSNGEPPQHIKVQLAVL